MLEQTGSKEGRNRYGLAKKKGNKCRISEKRQKVRKAFSATSFNI